MNIPIRYYPESDGGRTLNRYDPRTFYVVDREDFLGRIDCRSWTEAVALAEKLNTEEARVRGAR